VSRARDLADAGSKANFLDNVSADINATYINPIEVDYLVVAGGGAEGNYLVEVLGLKLHY
jgi:hypothetical protein